MTEIDNTNEKGNSIWQTFLNDFEIKCKKSRIASTVLTQKNLNLDFIEDADKYIIFENMLNNAVKTAARCGAEKRKIKVKLFMGTDFYLAFIIQNTYADIIYAKGTRAVKKLAKKYGGSFFLTREEKYCEAYLTISNAARENNT